MGRRCCTCPKSNCKQHLPSTCAFPEFKASVLPKKHLSGHISWVFSGRALAVLLLDHYRIAALFSVRGYSPYWNCSPWHRV